jgi:hypothetical protein
MGKYEALTKDILAIFGTPEWLAEGIKTYPANFVYATGPKTFLRVNVLPSGKGINLVSASGVLIVDIFTPAGGGPQPAMLIADKLDLYLAAKSVEIGSARTQFGSSAFDLKGIDGADPTLYRSVYTLPFSYFGASQ